MDELEIMRLQLNSLKDKLATQQIVNKELMRKVMQNKSTWLNKLVVLEIIMLPIISLMFAGICAYFEISQWFTIIFFVIGSIDTAFDWYLVRIPPRMFSTASIVDFQIFLIHQKKGRFWQVCISTPLSLIYLTAFLYALFRMDEYVTLFGALIGGIAGVTVVIILYRKMQSTNDTLISDIRELEEDRLTDNKGEIDR